MEVVTKYENLVILKALKFKRNAVIFTRLSLGDFRHSYRNVAVLRRIQMLLYKVQICALECGVIPDT